MTIKEPNTVATASTPCPSNMHPQEPNNIWVQNIATFFTSVPCMRSQLTLKTKPLLTVRTPSFLHFSIPLTVFLDQSPGIPIRAIASFKP